MQNVQGCTSTARRLLKEASRWNAKYRLRLLKEDQPGHHFEPRRFFWLLPSSFKWTLHSNDSYGHGLQLRVTRCITVATAGRNSRLEACFRAHYYYCCAALATSASALAHAANRANA